MTENQRLIWAAAYVMAHRRDRDQQDATGVIENANIAACAEYAWDAVMDAREGIPRTEESCKDCPEAASMLREMAE